MSRESVALLGAGLCALSVSGTLLVILIPLLHRWQVMDHPNHRSSHAVVTPRGGGLAVILAVVAGIALAVGLVDGLSGKALASVVTPCVALAAVGLCDDLRDLGTRTRLLAQAGVGVAVAYTLARVGTFGSASIAVLAVAAVLGGIYFVGVVNAVNFMDGVNGISGLTGLVAGLWYSFTGIHHHDPVLAVSGVALAGACLGFLPWNAPRAKVFLGDVGSYGVGALVGTLSMVCLLQLRDPLAAVAPLCVYLADTSVTLIRRWHAGERLGQAHRDHVYQRLVARGWTHSQASFLAAGAAALVCLALAISPMLAVPAALVGLGAYLALPDLLSRDGVEA